VTVENLKPLTSLRFLAALWVVLFIWWPNGPFAATPAFVANGYLGVDLFFALSGFILSHVYLQEAGERRFRYGSFLWNRLARVYPLHIVTLLGVGLLAGGATLAGVGVDPNILYWQGLPATLTLTHAWGFAEVSGWNHPSWSISSEWFAYLTFPIFAACAWALHKRPLVALGLSLAALFGANAGYHALTGELLTEATIVGGFLRIVPSFGYGCALYLVWKSGLLARLRDAWLVMAASLVAVIAAASLNAPDVLVVALFGPLLVSLAALNDAPSNPLSSKPFVYLGEISYSIYMIFVPWQLVAVNGLTKVLGLESEQLPLWAWLPSMAMLIPLAAFSYHFVEKPARQWMKGIAARQRREGTTPQVA